jgi:hypothetical protein
MLPSHEVGILGIGARLVEAGVFISSSVVTRTRMSLFNFGSGDTVS